MSSPAPSGGAIQRTTAIFRFGRNGQAQAHEVTLSYAKPCGYGTSRMDWHATRVTSARGALELHPLRDCA